MRSGVEIDSFVFGEGLVAVGRKLKQTAERWDRPGGQTSQFMDFLACRESQLAPAGLPTYRLACQPAIGRHDKHDHVLAALTD